MSIHAIVRWARSGAPIAALAALSAAGCEATFRPMEAILFPDEEGVLVRATWVPPDIWLHPRVFYGGTYAYLVDGRWYYLTDQGWMVFRREPIELSRERTRIGPGRVPR